MTTTSKTDRPKESLAERVYRELRAAIIIGEIAPGSTFNEAELVKQFEVSTSPLREALTRLHQDGLIKSIPRRGYMVTQLTLDDFHDLVQLRLVLEAAAAELAAPRMTDADIEMLIKLSRQVAEAEAANDARAFMDANQGFHELIAQRSGNPRLAKALRSNFEEVQRVLFAQFGKVQEETLGREDHQPIIDALARRNPAQARQAAIDHVKMSRDRVVSRFIRSTDALTAAPIGFH